MGDPQTGLGTKKQQREVSEMDREEYFCTTKFPNTKKALSMFKDDPLCAKPGSRFLYPTFGYTLLSAVVEAVTGEAFTDTVRATLNHMGLTETYLDQHSPIIYNRASYYVKDKSSRLQNAPYVDLSYKWAGGGLLSTAQDIVTFGNIILYSSQHQETDPGPPGFLKAATVSTFWKPAGQIDRMKRYGLGFELAPSKDHYGMCPKHNFGAGHTGAAIGVSSALFILPKSRQAMSNSSSEVQSVDHLNIASECQTNNVIPQGVVVAVFMNMVNVQARDVANKIARLFQEVDFDLEKKKRLKGEEKNGKGKKKREKEKKKKDKKKEKRWNKSEQDDNI